jgi:isoleucyl-tRNA synthetase
MSAEPASDPAFAPVPAEPDHVALELGVLERWDRDRTFEQLRTRNAGGPTFSFIDGPITANNPMGVHHAWGRSLKDLFQRYHAALGEDQRYQNGFDCQGLWVEVEVEKSLGLNSKREIEAYGLDRFARACRERVAEYSGVQTRQSIRLGMWMDWERSYYTMTDPNISYIWGFLKVCHDRGWLYQGHRPMVWCLRCGTSLSQHEVAATDSYRDIVDPSLYVRFRFTDAPGEAFAIWTTTPWTLPANVAATVNPDAEYVWVELDGERHAVAASRARRSSAATRPSSAACAAQSSSAARTRPASTTCPRRRASPIASSPTPASSSTRAPASSTSRPAAAPRTTRSGAARTCRCSRPSTRRASSSRATASSPATTPTRCPTSSSSTSSAAAGCCARSPTSTATRTAGAAASS